MPRNDKQDEYIFQGERGKTYNLFSYQVIYKLPLNVGFNTDNQEFITMEEKQGDNLIKFLLMTPEWRNDKLKIQRVAPIAKKVTFTQLKKFWDISTIKGAINIIIKNELMRQSLNLQYNATFDGWFGRATDKFYKKYIDYGRLKEYKTGYAEYLKCTYPVYEPDLDFTEIDKKYIDWYCKGSRCIYKVTCLKDKIKQYCERMIMDLFDVKELLTEQRYLDYCKKYKDLYEIMENYTDNFIISLMDTDEKIEVSIDCMRERIHMILEDKEDLFRLWYKE